MKEDRIPYIEKLVAAGIGCEICPVLEEFGVQVHCAGRIEGMHERRKSGSGGSRMNHDNLIPACNWGNGYLEDCTGDVRIYVEEVGLVVREGHPDWDRFSKRHDRSRVDEA